MLTVFLNHQRKAFWRSRNKGRSIVAQIFLGFVVLYFLLLAIGVGIGMEFVIEKIFPEKDVFYVFNGLILYYFAFDFVARLQLQELPTLSIVPYLHLNIPKHKIVRFLNVRSLFSIFNILPIFVFIPFCGVAISEVYGWFVAAMYSLAIVSLSAFNNFAVMYVKRLSTLNSKAVIAVTLTIAAFAGLEYFNILSISLISNHVFGFLTLHPTIGLSFSLAAIASIKINTAYLRRNLYTEELSKTEEEKITTDYPFFDRFGPTGVLAVLELKLMLRHKRTRSLLFMTLFFMLYGFIFYKKAAIDRNEISMILFAAIFMTGSSISMYGQFLYGWQASHFDGLIVNKINLRSFIAAKFLLFSVMSTLVLIATSLYGLISLKLLYIQLAAYLYNIGIGTVMVLYFATWNSKAIDLKKSAALNYQGVSGAQFVLSIPYFLLPYIIYLPFSYAGHPYWGITCLGIAGLAAILTRSYWITFLIKALNKRRYKITEGFRER